MKPLSQPSLRDTCPSQSVLLLMLTLLFALDPRHQSVDAAECFFSSPDRKSAECRFCSDTHFIDSSITELKVLPGRCAEFGMMGLMSTELFESLSELETLIISGNINTTHLRMPFDFGNLQTIDLSNNGIYALETQFPTSVKVLNLSSNRMSRLANTTFQTLDSLETLDLSWNPFQTIEDNVFSSLSSLREIQMNGANVTNPPEKLFNNLRSLKRVYMKWCNMHFLPHLSLSGTSLDVLDLTGNYLKYIPAVTLLKAQTMPHTVVLANNIIQEIWDLRSMTIPVLDLSRNPLFKIHEGSFSGSNISYLDLSSTALTNLPKFLDGPLRSAPTILNLDDTFMPCDCHVPLWLGDFLDDSPYSVSPICEYDNDWKYHVTPLHSEMPYLRRRCDERRFIVSMSKSGHPYAEPKKVLLVHVAVIGSAVAFFIISLPIMFWVCCSASPKIEYGW